MNKPVILIGNGLRNNPGLVAHLCSLSIPVLTTWMSLDLIAEDDPAFCGRPGIFGQRAANIIQQKADALYVFGARLDGEQVAYDYQRFAPRAKKFVYDIDRAELNKFPADWVTIPVDLTTLKTWTMPGNAVNPEWLAWCKALYRRFHGELEGCNRGDYIDTFALIDCLGDVAQPDDLLAIGSSSGAVNAFLQAFRVKAGQRVTVCATIGAMGADIPMAVGGCMASGKRTICVTGDGGFQLNAQELEVVRRYNLPIKYIVVNNDGYNSIRVMQKARFDGRIVGANPASGFTIAPICGLAEAYRIPYWRADRPQDLEHLGQLLGGPGPKILEIMVDPAWEQLPRVMASGTPLRTDDMQDMTPHLPPDELRALMEWGND